MYNNCAKVIRGRVAVDAWKGVATDVYKLASELVLEQPNYTQDQLVEMICKAASELKGTSIIWERRSELQHNR